MFSVSDYLKIQLQPELHLTRTVELTGDTSKGLAGDACIRPAEDHLEEAATREQSFKASSQFALPIVIIVSESRISDTNDYLNVLWKLKERENQNIIFGS